MVTIRHAAALLVGAETERVPDMFQKIETYRTNRKMFLVYEISSDCATHELDSIQHLRLTDLLKDESLLRLG